jgi:hypothetical protein
LMRALQSPQNTTGRTSNGFLHLFE